MMVDILTAMRAGEDERLITDNREHWISMRAVRDPDGQMLGYYQRWGAPAKQGKEQ
jgi:hypothetical protein